MFIFFSRYHYHLYALKQAQTNTCTQAFFQTNTYFLDLWLALCHPENSRWHKSTHTLTRTHTHTHFLPLVSGHSCIYNWVSRFVTTFSAIHLFGILWVSEKLHSSSSSSSLYSFCENWDDFFIKVDPKVLKFC